MKIIFFFTHKRSEIRNMGDRDPPGFNVDDTSCPIQLKSNGRQIVYYFKVESNVVNWKEKVTEIINHYNLDSAESIYFFHYQTMKPETIRGNLSLHGKVVEKFTSSGDTRELWDQITGIKCVCQGGKVSEPQVFEKIFDEIWNRYSVRPRIHRLRYGILSPLVALDLIKQAEVNSSSDKSTDLSTLKNEIETAIDNLGESIKEFCELPIKCDEFKDQLEKLRKYEKYSSWKDYHKELKEVAEGMEEQIAAIES
ncbi:MAG: hypothetical protein H8D67_17300 [Deltaproteobacteria bacterium]|nr:hypothetical protein [Deltaproteobacteria bacterium]MBL7075343.1 hypothetical protein [candidate division KSB1 bacterium]